MITESAAMAQLIRGRGLPRFPSEPAAWTEVTTAMMHVSRSPEHARAIMDRIMRTAKWYPVPAEIYEMAEEVQPPEITAPFAGQRTCEDCRGSGYMSALYLVTWERSGRKREHIDRKSAALLAGRLGGPGVQELYEASEYCPCDYGRHLAMKRSLREAEEAEGKS